MKPKFSAVFLISILFLSVLAYRTKSRWYSKFKHGLIEKSHEGNRKDLAYDAKNAVWGIDLSHHQGHINWDKLCKNNKPYFAFFKVTEGVSHKDTRFSKYIKQAREKEIRVGAYHFFSYSSSGKNQALHFLKHAQLQKGDLPYVLDAEYKRKMPKQQKVSTEIKAFLETVEKQTGVRPIIYCEQDYYNKYIKNEIEKDYPLWVCDFRRKPTFNHSFWQKSDKFKLAGVSGRVDFNVFNGSQWELERLAIR